MDELCPQCKDEDVIIVGLTGKAGCGKDTVGQMLVDAGFQRYGFADELKQAVLDLDPIVGSYIVKPFMQEHQRLSEVVDAYGMDWAKRELPEVRRLLQVFGTEVIRKRDPDFWINAVQQKILDTKPLPRKIVITDVRFDDEAKWIRQSSWTNRVVEIVRPDADAGANAGHSSEAGVDRALITDHLHNTGTLEDLAGMVEELRATW